MEYNEFKKTLIGMLKENLSEDELITEEIVCKINGEMCCLSIRNGKAGISAAFYPKKLYRDFQYGVPMKEIVKAILEGYTASKKELSEGLKMFVPDKGRSIKDTLDSGQANIWPVLVSAKLNQHYVEQGFPHRRFLDFLILYNLYSSEAQAGTMVSSGIAEELQLSEDDLYNLAMETITEKFPVKDMELDRRRGFVKGAYDEEAYHFAFAPIVILSQSAENSFGAASLLDIGLLDKVSAKLDDDLIIIPANIHEILVIPGDALDPDDFRLLIKEMNENVVPPEQYLSDSVYFYDRTCKKVSIVENKKNSKLIS